MRYQHLFKLSLILFTLSLLLAACSGVANNTGSSNGNSGNSGESGAFKVAILLPGPIDDTGWSQTGYDGLKYIEKELGAQIAYTASVPGEQAKQEEILRQYAKDGYNFILAHGGEYTPALEVVAKEFPQTRFAIITGYGGNNKNLGGLAVRSDEDGFLAGAVAGLKTTSNKVAYIGGQQFPSTEEEAAAFELGVKHVNPAAEVSIAWVDSWSDQEKAKEIALTQIEAGVDVLAVDAAFAGLAVLTLAEEKGIHAIGWIQDQHELAPKAVVVSALQQMNILMLEGAKLVQQGRWEGKQYKMGLQEDVVDLSPLYGDWTPEQKETIKQVKEDIISGKIDALP